MFRRHHAKGVDNAVLSSALHFNIELKVGQKLPADLNVQESDTTQLHKYSSACPQILLHFGLIIFNFSCLYELYKLRNG